MQRPSESFLRTCDFLGGKVIIRVSGFARIVLGRIKIV